MPLAWDKRALGTITSVTSSAWVFWQGRCHPCPQMGLSIPQCSHWSHLSELRDRKDPGCGPACEEPAVGMECRARPGTALLSLPWVSRAPRPLPVSQGRQEEPGTSRDTAATTSLQTPSGFLTSPQLPACLPPVPLPPRGHCHCPPCQPPTWGTPGTWGTPSFPVGSTGKSDFPLSLASCTAHARV